MMGRRGDVSPPPAAPAECDAANDGAEVAISEDGANAGHRLRRADIDAIQSRMRHRAAHEARMQEAGERDVVDKASAAAQQCRVLDA
jgi:hypothetical protein